APPAAAVTQPAPAPPAFPAPPPTSDPPSPARPLPRFPSRPPAASGSRTRRTPPPGRRLNPLAPGPRIGPEPALPHKPGPSGAPVVVPSLSAPAPAPAPAEGGSRRRTLTGTGDLRWLEGLRPPADAMDPNRHGTLVGLGIPAPTARLEP